MNFEKYTNEFIQKVDTYKNGNSHYKLGYPPHSITFFEALLLYTLAKEHNIDCFIESGVRLGGSTSIWSRVFSNLEVYSVELGKSKGGENPEYEDVVVWIKNNVVPAYPKINFEFGDGNVLLPKIIENNPNKKFGVFIDGPKETEGLKLAEKCVSYDNVCFSTLHDSLESTEHFTTFKYGKLDQLIESVKVLNDEHPGFEDNPNGYNLAILEKN